MDRTSASMATFRTVASGHPGIVVCIDTGTGAVPLPHRASLEVRSGDAAGRAVVRGHQMSSTGSAKVSEDTARDSPTLAELDASVGLYDSGPDDAVVAHYRSDGELLAAMQHRRAELRAD